MPRQSENKTRIRTTRWPASGATDRWRDRTSLTGDQLAAAWATFIGRIKWSRFWTLTFDPQRRDRVGQELASREAFAWVRQVGRVQRQPLGWVYATERGESGLWHAHALTTGTSVEVDEYMMLDWRLRNGHSNVIPVTDTVQAVMYTTKDAARRGEVVCADTLIKYREFLGDAVTVGLAPD